MSYYISNALSLGGKKDVVVHSCESDNEYLAQDRYRLLSVSPTERGRGMLKDEYGVDRAQG